MGSSQSNTQDKLEEYVHAKIITHKLPLTNNHQIFTEIKNAKSNYVLTQIRRTFDMQLAFYCKSNLWINDPLGGWSDGMKAMYISHDKIMTADNVNFGKTLNVNIGQDANVNMREAVNVNIGEDVNIGEVVNMREAVNDEKVVDEIIKIPNVKQRLASMKCPSCRVINKINLDTCRTHARTGVLPEDYEEKVEIISKMGMKCPSGCTVCLSNYADVTLPQCKHDDICYDCVCQLVNKLA